MTTRLIDLDRRDIVNACRLHDAMGPDAFLAAGSFRPSRHWVLRFEGRSYPSKAILGVAAGRNSSQLFGGAAHTVRTLMALDFEVRRGRRVVKADDLRAHARTWGRRGFIDACRAWSLDKAPVAYFASSTNVAGEIRGMARVGHDVGVAVPELTAPGMAELKALAGTDVQVFVDSGAFSEVSYNAAAAQLQVTKPMTAGDWDRVLGCYEELAGDLGDQLHVVAPDRVGDQLVTLARLTTYADRLLALMTQGVRVLVPMQAGEMSLEQLGVAVDAILGVDAWVPAFPCKKAATTPDAIETYVVTRKPEHVHLLGMGPRNGKAREYLGAATAAGGTCSCDSNLIAASVGRGGRQPRAYTRARDIARKLVAQANVAELGVMVWLAIGLA